MGRTRNEKIQDVLNVLFFVIVTLGFIYPFWYLLALSFNSAADTMANSIVFLPNSFTLANYEAVFNNDSLLNAYLITILRTVIGTAFSVMATGMFAYGMSKKYLVFHTFFFTLTMITMFFHGGLIPTVLLIKSMGLMNNFMVYIIPALVNVVFMLIMRTYYLTLSPALEESAKIDGYNDLQIFFKIVLPSSLPIIAAIALFNGVAQWNSW
ncbi:MAG TPA: carbohydrate ABC transporter permease, partial [Bacilli bacterium]